VKGGHLSECRWRRDIPLTGNWRPASSVSERLGLEVPRKPARAEALERIATEAIVMARARPGRWISYSRRKAFYVGGGRYRATCLTHSTVAPSVDQLAAAGLIEHDRAYPGRWNLQSRFRASEELIAIWEGGGPEITHAPRELIVLRGCDGELLDYADTEQTAQWRRNLAEINEAITSTEIRLDGRLIRDGEPLHLEAVQFGAAHSDLHRVFNRASFEHGGRFYGGWFQNVPKDQRASITINGEPIIEHDYRSLHPRLLYAQAGKPLQGDPYELLGWPRPLVKVGFNMRINADTPMAAIRSLARESELAGEGAYARARQLISDIEEKHQSIRPAFSSGAGLRLQRLDSDMAQTVILRMAQAHGAVVLPIHDSFICAKRFESQLQEAMDMALREAEMSLSSGNRFHNMVQNPVRCGSSGSVLLVASNDNNPCNSEAA
jgi:hypothetical protein